MWYYIQAVLKRSFLLPPSSAQKLLMGHVNKRPAKGLSYDLQRVLAGFFISAQIWFVQLALN